MIIGITGGIGSGKSTIARELAKQGFAVYDCDREAKRIIAQNEPVQRAIIDLLGPESFVDVPGDNGQGAKEYNTPYVAQRVFAEPNLLERLNSIVHPAVAQDIRQSAVRVQSSGVLFIESAILFESGFDALCEKIIVVEAPEEVRIARTIARDYQGVASPEHINKVRARICAQRTAVPSTPHDILHLNNDGSTPIADLVAKVLNML